ncbi:uncharacterized protein EAE97_004937 [Botrytis byssoidea]|uniref:Abscisic acid G-protein coupled receptor-like domain-containing protein n=1 Tax=Botrytis byssoidea TaxID=139641 RepID=A0A9P5IRV0_9HELO|nr:uncharacterized protein EAE97_004937 [Botrytis byssoidea]KAF7945899.1 hypothetical protein EAE97_004937 [Botrytis byssoidea]
MSRFLKPIVLLLVAIISISLYQAIKKCKQPPPTLSEIIMSYIQEHPFRCALHAINLLTFFTPTTAGTSFLYQSDFAHLRPGALFIASISQSIFGNVATRSLFAYLQSAAMSGYVLGAFNIVVRSVSGVGSVVRFCWGGKSVRGNHISACVQDFVGDLSLCVFLVLAVWVLIKIGIMGYRLLHGVMHPVGIHTEQMLGEAGE